MNFSDVVFENTLSLGDGDNTLTSTGEASFTRVSAGNGNDVFNLSSAGFSGALDLGDGDNSMTVTSSLTCFNSVTAGAGNDTINLTGSDNVSTFSGMVDLGLGENYLYIEGNVTGNIDFMIHEGGRTTAVVYRGASINGKTVSVYSRPDASLKALTLDWSSFSGDEALDKVRILISSDATFSSYEYSIELYNRVTDFTINVEEQRTASVSIGGGIDSVTGVFGSVGIADNNFLGRNERLSLNGIVGTGVILNDASIKRRMNLQAELSYFKPYFYNADTSLMSKIFYRDFGSYQVPLAIERRIGAEATVAHRMKSNKHVTSTFSLGVENIDVSEGDGAKISSLYSKYNIPISERAKQLDGGFFLSLSPALLYDTRDNATVTRKGTMASIRFDEELGIIDFDKTHGKLTGMVKQYIPVGKKSSLSFTAKGGGKIHGDNMPEVMAYRLGGPYTIRGFKMSGVGTGDAFIMGSAEFATPIPFLDRTRINFLNNLRFTVWADAGKIFNPSVTDQIYDRPLYAVSAGIGLKLYIPGMGPLSIDYGIPLTNPGDNGSRSGYFTFGVGDIMY